jgi:predicted NAD/FAD-dependent oxidoreductase
VDIVESFKRVAIVGAGVSGLACAKLLGDHGIDVVVFDKSRGTGGRASTHRSGDYAFDSGAQYFTARDALFVAQVDEWVTAGIAAAWRGETVRLRDGEVLPGQGSTQRFVGMPGMSSISRHLSRDCRVTTGFRVVRLEQDRDGVALVSQDDHREGGFDAVVVATPAPQTAALVRSAAPDLAAVAERVPFSACLALMVAFRDRLPLGFDGAFVDDSPLSWVSRDSSKPGRLGDETWVLHAAPSWSDENFAAEEEVIVESLRQAFVRATGVAMPEPLYSRLHRWRYALPPEPLPDRFLFDATNGIGACGDWCAGPRVEGAFLSGTALAERVLQWFVEGTESRARRS